MTVSILDHFDLTLPLISAAVAGAELAVVFG
jgi:hypothetical protein